MSLNNNQMLPVRVRSMRQMKDVLNVEDIVLAEIERIIDEIDQRASILHEELVNEKWLEKNLERILDAIVSVNKSEKRLHVNITINSRNMVREQEEVVIAFINKWLPAHLAYSIFYDEYLKAKSNLAVLWQDDELITMRQVKL